MRATDEALGGLIAEHELSASAANFVSRLAGGGRVDAPTISAAWFVPIAAHACAEPTCTAEHEGLVQVEHLNGRIRLCVASDFMGMGATFVTPDEAAAIIADLQDALATLP